MPIIGLLAFFQKVPWKLVGVLLLAALVIGAVSFFARYFYAQGVSAERLVWQTRSAHVSRETIRASGAIVHQNAITNASISHALTQGSQSIQAISHDETDLVFFNSWRDADKRLRDAADAASRNNGA